MKISIPRAAVVVAVLFTPIAGASAQEKQASRQDVVVKEESAGLLAQAKIRPDSAIALAILTVPDGQIVKAEIEMEDGVLLYSFDLKRAGVEGISEVHVDAVTGKVGGVEREEHEHRQEHEDQDQEEDGDGHF